MTGSLTSDVLAGHRAAAPAVAMGDEAWSHGQLRARTDALSAWLDHAGARPGDAIAIVLPNSLDAVAWTLAIWQIGAVDVALPPGETSARLGRILDRVRPVALIAAVGAPCLDGVAGTIHDGPPLGRDVRAAWLGAREGGGLGDALAARGVCSIQFTSGSTGEPKGVMHTRAAIGASVFVAAHFAELPGQRLLLTLPICNSYGRTHLLEYLRAGGDVMLATAAMPGDVLAALASSGATSFEAPPVVYEALVRHQSFGQAGLPRLRRLGTAGGKLSARLVATLHERFPGGQLVNRYGVTEISGALCRGRLVPGEAVHCGAPLPHVDLRLEPVDGALDGAGRIFARSPGMMAGYFPELVAPEWYDTGDVGCLDGGRMRLLDRASDMVKRAGIRVFPAEVEREIAAWPGVSACVALGVTLDDRSLEYLAAFVVPAADGPTRAALIETARRLLPTGYVPDLLLTVAELPIAATGKVDRQALRELARRQLAAPRDRITSAAPPRG